MGGDRHSAAFSLAFVLHLTDRMGGWNGGWKGVWIGLDQIGTLPLDELINGRFLRRIDEFFRLVFVVTSFFFLLTGGG